MKQFRKNKQALLFVKNAEKYLNVAYIYQFILENIIIKKNISING